MRAGVPEQNVTKTRGVKERGAYQRDSDSYRADDWSAAAPPCASAIVASEGGETGE